MSPTRPPLAATIVAARRNADRVIVDPAPARRTAARVLVAPAREAAGGGARPLNPPRPRPGAGWGAGGGGERGVSSQPGRGGSAPAPPSRRRLPRSLLAPAPAPP